MKSRIHQSTAPIAIGQAERVPAGAAAVAVRSSIGVLVCTHRRPSSLQHCLDGLAAQTRIPEDVIVVCRPTDQATLTLLRTRPADGLPIRIVSVTTPGIVAARNAGHDACRTDVIAWIDDDVVPHIDWLRRIGQHFDTDPLLGGLGGRDHVHDGDRFDERLAQTVGRLQWFGRAIGNHHLGYGPSREVHFLKGANMSYRAVATAGARFDTRLRGRSIEAHEDLAFSLGVQSNGWKLLYDPAVLVYHYAGRGDLRAYSSISAAIAPAEIRDAACNKVIALWAGLSAPRRAAFVLWSALIGTGVEPGLVQAIRYTPSLGMASWRRFWLVQIGRAAGYRAVASLSRGRPVDARLNRIATQCSCQASQGGRE